ncbi:MAG TPA: hypothetical protein VF710_23970 [Longimicrobium sp.]|jgi:hypothetical protein
MGEDKPQIELRVPAELEEEEMLRMFDKAWDSLSADEQAELRQEREDWLNASREPLQHGLGTRRA